MATLTAEQIEQKKQLLKQTLEKAKTLRDELQAAGALQLNEDDLDKVAGGNVLEDVRINPQPVI